jgi:hypothetical protein
MHVLAVALGDQPATILNATHALCARYWYLKKESFSERDQEELQELAQTLWQRMGKFADFGVSLNTPKMHCAAKFGRTVELFGSVQHVTTDAYERAHKVHKAVFARYDA